MKKFFAFILFIPFLGNIVAQNYTQSFNEVFQYVNLNQASTGIVYERVLPLSNLMYYTTNRIHPMDTCNSVGFEMAYDELYRAGGQYSFLPYSIDYIMGLLSDTTTVTLGVIHARFNTFDTSAIRQKLYFDADSILREDTSVHIPLFNEDTAFIVAPLAMSMNSLNVKYVINESFFFDNTQNSVSSLLIDFDDGYGYRIVSRNSVVNIVYSSDGYKILKSISVLQNGDSISSCFKLFIGNNTPRENGSSYPYTEDLTIPASISFPNPYSGGNFNISNGNVRIYYAHADKKLRKPVLIVDGFDPQNNRHFETTNSGSDMSLWDKLGDGISYNVGELLLSLEYDVVLLDLPDGGKYIEQNAMVCIAVINMLNNRLQENNSDEQIVVVGPSMGGQITRYALAYMEQNPNENTNYGYHNCRLWVSFDSPHQGANVSIGAQAMVDYFRSEYGNGPFANLWNNTLSCIAAKQMLICHKNSSAHFYFNTYYQQLNNLGYPVGTRKVGISNGSLNNISNGTANDIAFKAVAHFYFVPIITLPYLIDICIRHMANSGSNQVFKVTHWVGPIPIPTSLTYSNNSNRGSLDVAPGCKYNTFDQISDKIPSYLNNWIVTIANNQHKHCFMPVTSVLDYDGQIAYATNLANRDLVAEGKIPFDSYWGPHNKNMDHISFDNNLVNYLINEIETYIQGEREVQLCTQPVYTLHLPQDSIATITWECSDNIRIIQTSGNSVTIMPMAAGDGWIRAEASSLKHRTKLAKYPIHISVNENNNLPVVTTTSIPQQNLLISGEMLLTNDFFIDSSKTLTITGTLHCSPGSRIIVRPGGKLIVNGGTLTNACDGEMWQGIIVEGNASIRQAALAQGSVILNNATIENASDAICTRGSDTNVVFEHTGGIIQATNTLFHNNRRSVEFLSYENHTTSGAVTDNVSYFTRCTFTVDNDNLFAQNGTSFNSHVTMWHVRGVKFNGCAFRNETSNHGGKAIYTEEAGFTARRVCPQVSNFDPCVCNNYGNDTVARCSFSGFDTAVHATNGHASYAVTLDNCDFSNNYIGIYLAAADNAQVSFCDFDLDYTLNANTGVYLKNSTSYTVESNSFHRTRYSTLTSVGVCTDNSGTAENVIRLNDFGKLTYGCYAWNCNAVIGMKTRGLQYVCNSYDSCKYSIYVRSSAKIRTAQGNSSVGADNSFYNNIGIGRSITIPSDHTNVSYYYHNSGSHAPMGSSNYTLYQATNANSCASTLCGGGMVNPKGALALSQYLSMAEEYATIVETLRATSLQTDANDLQDETDNADLIGRLSDLSAAMGDLARAEIRKILNDSIPDMGLLRRWYATIVETAYAPPLSIADSPIPVAVYQLAETYSMEGDLAAAATLLSSLPQQFTPDEASRNEYANYMALQQLRETVDGNWYTLTDTDIEAMRQVAEYNNGRAARMAKEILCFFHHICYEDEPLVDLDGIGERALRGDEACPIATTNGALLLHPNPATHTLTVETSSPICTLTVYDLAGRVMMTVDGGDAFFVMNVSSLPNGIYLLRVVTDSGVETGRFVKN